MQQTYVKQVLTKKLGKNYTMLRRLHGGMMNVSFVVRDKLGKDYIIYLPNGKANKLVNRENEKTVQKYMYELGITSKNIYFNTHTGIKINEYIEGESLNNVKEYDLQKIADMFHKIHDCKKLAPTDYHPLQRLMNYENALLSYQKEDHTYRRLRDFFSSRLYVIGKVENNCICHNDAQKSNVIVTPDGEYKIIDFEFMANNDPIYDIASFANNTVEEGEALMRYYFVEPTTKEWQRFYLWRIFISLQWHVMALIKHNQNEGKNTKINFVTVSKHFLKNALIAEQRFIEIETKIR